MQAIKKVSKHVMSIATGTKRSKYNGTYFSKDFYLFGTVLSIMLSCPQQSSCINAVFEYYGTIVEATISDSRVGTLISTLSRTLERISFPSLQF